jgi:stage IV sporulation protein FB
MNPFGGAIVRSLLWANVALVVFNMIPAFPMDGGRVLRSLLALVVSHENATLVAATVGQAAAIAFGVFGIWSQQWMLVLVALFVFLAARAELQASRAAAQRSQWGMVRDVMLRQFHTVPAQSPLEDVAQTALFTGQHSFPVVDGNRLVGMLDQQQVLSAMSAGGGNRPVTDVMRREFPLIDENDPIDNTYQRMQSAGHRGLPVFSAGRLVGLLPLERVRQWLVYLAMHAEKLPQRETYDATLPEASRAT